jgi:hypothetical protein
LLKRAPTWAFSWEFADSPRELTQSPCHPERSMSKSEANRHTQSKDPYLISRTPASICLLSWCLL